MIPLHNGPILSEMTVQDQKEDTSPSLWTRTTVVLREEHLEKLKMLAWWERTTIKDIFNKMVEEYLSSKTHLDRLMKERQKSQRD